MDETKPKERRTDRNLTSKIWAVFFVSLLTSFGVFYWNYDNFETLSGSINRLSQPNEKIDIINEIFQEIIEAENSIQSYILTDNGLSETTYRGKIANVRQNISKLKDLLRDDSVQVKRVDTLQSIFNVKLNYLERFLYVKKIKQSSLFTNEAMNRIARNMNDTAFIDKQFLRREILKGDTIPVEKEEIVITPDEFKGLKGFVRKLFGRDNTKIDTVRTIENETFYTYDVAVDTSIVRDYFRDSTLLAVKNILSRVMRKEVRMQQQLTQTELDLLRQNQVFIINIRLIIEQLKNQEKAVAASNILNAKKLASQSTRIMLLIGFVGLSMSGIFIFFILRDVTRAFHYRRQLEHQKIKAEKLAAVKEEFLSNMSHEIRTPLHNILGFSSLLALTKLDRKQETYLNAINQSNAYLSELVNGILDEAKIGAGKLYLYNEPFDLVKIVDELKSVFSFSALKKKIVLKTKIPEALHAYHLIGDAFRIKQILNNLLSNAVKFTDEGSISLIVEGKKKADAFDLAIDVTDTGIGVSADKLDSIFDQFVQEKPHTARTYGGTGLGLSISKSLIEAMGGTITARNNENKGATFSLFLSLPCVNAPEAPSETGKARRKYFAGIHAVVVEDDEWNGLLLKEILVPRVAEVHVFKNAVDALAFLQDGENPPGIIFSDIKMPGLQGDAFMKKVRAMKMEVPIIALTAHARPDKLNKLKEEGFDHVCKKPFEISDIENILELYFEGESENNQGFHGQPAPEFESPVSGERFDFSAIKKFAGDNEAVFAHLVKELVENNERQLRAFAKYLFSVDSKKLAELCHQMKTSYDHLQLHALSELLASIEVHGRLGNDTRVIEIAHELYPRLQNVLSALQNIRHQYHIV